jgi:hypothetical protein
MAVPKEEEEEEAKRRRTFKEYPQHHPNDGQHHPRSIKVRI